VAPALHKEVENLAFHLADAINDAGWSVGYSQTASGADAVLWSPSGKAMDLGNIQGSAWSDTQAVHNSGDIIGEYQGELSSFLLMHISGASSDHYDAVISHDGSAALAAVRDHCHHKR
jgi:hypothetical protein